jgi:hypothetical protein
MCSAYWGDRSFGKRNLTDIIKSCTYGINKLDCRTNAENYFERYYDDLFMDCIRFNTGRNISGHSVEILNSTTGGMDDSLSMTVNTSASLAVWVHDPSSPPKNHWENNRNGDMNIVLPNLYTIFVFEKLVDIKLRHPYNRCLEDVELFKKNRTVVDYMDSLNRSLSRDLCVDISFAIDYLENNPCNCTANATLGDLWNKCVLRGLYSSENTDKCSLEYYRNVFLSTLVTKYCPQQCETTSYLVETVLMKSFSYDLVSFSAYYKSLKYTVINQKPEITFSSLISNVGGIMGLFLGINFLSFIEIIELILETIIIILEI